MKSWKRTGILVAILFAALALLVAQRAWADAAPPPEAAASDIAPGQGTQVQMISETVVLDVRVEPMARGDYTFTPTVALVTADFLMRNLGSVTETMDVRFPMAWLLYSDRIVPDNVIQDINVLVDGEQVVTRQASFDGQPWAVWPVTFPPGRDVQMTVKYRTVAIESGTLADFYYILETGAGWRGPIGQGDIIFQFPYPASLEMVELNHVNYSHYDAATPAFVAEGYQLRWRFTNLEPTSKDNVRLLVLAPPVWQAVLAARQEAQSKPNDAQAQLRLGESYWAAVPVKNGWPEASSLADHFGPLAEAAFKRAAELAPNDTQTQVMYARFLACRALSETPEPYYSRARQQIQRVLALDPNNVEAQELLEYPIGTIGLVLARSTPTGAIQPATPAPSPTLTIAPTASPRPATPPPTSSLAPTATPPLPGQPNLCGGAAIALVVTGAAAGVRRKTSNARG